MRQTTPIRQCIGCGQRDEQRQLLRFTVGVDGALRDGTRNGRGAYIHRQRICIQRFATSRAGLVRSWGVMVSREMRARYAALMEQYTMQESGK